METRFEYKLPGGLRSCDSFHDMNRAFVEEFYDWAPDNEASKKTVFVPTCRETIQVEPLTGKSGESNVKSTSVAYERMRTAQKGENDELIIARYIEKLGRESSEPMFVFHGVKITQWKCQLLEYVAIKECSLTLEEIEQFQGRLKEIFFPNNSKKFQELEIDFAVVHKTLGIVVLEVKGRQDKTKKSRPRNRLRDAENQLNRDAKFLKLLSALFGGKICDLCANNVSKIALLINDTYAECTEELRGRAMSYKIWAIPNTSDKNTLDYASFVKYWQSIIPAAGDFLNIYRLYVPLLLALTVGECDTRSFALSSGTIDSGTLLSAVDKQINEEKLSSRQRNEAPITNVETMKKESIFLRAKTMRLLYLTPEQQKIFYDEMEMTNHTRVLIGVAVAGKTVLMMFKILEIATMEAKSTARPVLVVSPGLFANVYANFLRQNGLPIKFIIDIQRSDKKPCEETQDDESGEEEKSQPASGFENVSIEDIFIKHGNAANGVTFEVSLSPGYVYVCANDVLDDATGIIINNLRQQEDYVETLQNPNSIQQRTEGYSKILLNVFQHSGFHLFIDDATDMTTLKLMSMQDSSNLSPAIKKDLYCWIALDHTQSNFVYEDDSGSKCSEFEQTLKACISQRGGVFSRLTEVLRNSREIYAIMYAAATHIAKNIQKTDFSGLMTCPHNFHGDTIEIFELWDEKTLPRMAEHVEEYENTFARFCRFICQMINERYNKANFGIALGTETKIAVLIPDAEMRFELKCKLEFCGSSLKDFFSNAKSTESSFTILDDAMNATSFEWAVVLIVLPFRYIAVWAEWRRQNQRQHSLLQDDEFEKEWRETFWTEFYLGCTRPRTKLAIVGGPQTYEAYFKPLSLASDSIITKKYVQTDAENFSELQSAKLSADGEQWLNSVVPHMFESGYSLQTEQFAVSSVPATEYSNDRS